MALIRKEFESRKGKISKKEALEREREKKKDEEEASRMAKVRAAEFTSKKIAGLEIKARESYLSLLETNLRSNYDQFSKVASSGDLKLLSSHDILQCAIEEEYKIFSKNKVITTYRRGMAFLMAAVKKNSDAWELHQSLKDFDPSAVKPESSFTIEDTNSKSSKDIIDKGEGSIGKNFGGVFQSALEMSKDKKPSDKTKNTSDKTSRGKGFRLKRDPLTQTGIKSFFKKSEKAASTDSASSAERTKERWKSVGLSDESDEELRQAAENPKVSDNGQPGFSFNFYSDTLDKGTGHAMSASSSSPDSVFEDPSNGVGNGNDDAFEEKDYKVSPAEEVPEPEDQVQEPLVMPNDGYEDSDDEVQEEAEAFAAELRQKTNVDSIDNWPGDEDFDQELPWDRVEKLEEEFKKIKQQMAEGEDHINYELKLRKDEEDKEKRARKIEEKKKKMKEKSRKKIGQHNEKHKIKVKVETVRVKHPSDHRNITKAPKKSISGSSAGTPEKKEKMKTADLVVKMLVPHFKKGMIASKEVFKFFAREMTHNLLKRDDCKDLDSAGCKKYLDDFFRKSGIILTEADAKMKISQIGGDTV